ncbi:MAG: DUF2238 domain-containing protein [Phycisphaerae bacterium]
MVVHRVCGFGSGDQRRVRAVRVAVRRDLRRPEQADDFLGGQGDIWDAQKDVFMSLCGAVI